MTRDPKPTKKEPEAYHREQIWVFRVHEKKGDEVDPWHLKHTKARAKTLESALKQLHVRFPEDKYELKYVKTEPIVSDQSKRAAKVVNEAVRAAADYRRNEGKR